MNAFGSGAENAVAHAIVDEEGRLLTADPALEALHARAGGEEGGMLAVPQLVTATRLARRLGVPVSRGVTVADEDADLKLWVRAQPEGGRVRLSVSGWCEVPPWRSERMDAAALVAADADWRWETDAALRLAFVSLDAAAAAGLDAFALLGQPLTQLFALDEGEDGALPILDALARRQSFVDQPARVRASGRAVTLSAAVRRDGDGGFAGFSGATTTMPQPSAEPGVSSLPETFTGGLDRALRAPLARIVANADSMSAGTEGPLAAGYADYAADIAHAGRHLLDLIDDLVDLQALERPDFLLPTEPIDLADVARRAAGLLGVRAAEAEVTVERPALGMSAPAMGDFRRALQIAVNLLGNALRYSPAGAAVTIEAFGEGDTARLVVTDRGKGIASADQARIFAKFERVDPGEPGGNGLGLYIARRLARAMGGDLTVASAPGEGARFTFSLTSAPPHGRS